MTAFKQLEGGHSVVAACCVASSFLPLSPTLEMTLELTLKMVHFLNVQHW